MNVALILFLVVAVAASVAPPRAARSAGDLRYEVVLGKAAYALGETVAISLRVTNTAGAVVAVTYGGQQYDVVVRQRGGLVWQWSHDKAFAQVMHQASLAPGETRTYQVLWDQRDLQGRQVDPGAYEAWGVFMATSREGAPPVEVGSVRLMIGR